MSSLICAIKKKTVQLYSVNALIPKILSSLTL